MKGNHTGVIQKPDSGAASAPSSWQELLREAITKPGFIHEAYTRFHCYSVGNQMLALWQCQTRSIPPGPIATFPKWKELGRFVKKGEKALVLCMPLTGKRTETEVAQDGTEQEVEHSYTRFTYKPHWFVLAQTEGTEYRPEPIPAWDETKALAALHITRETFTELDGNIQGCAKRGRVLAINPLAVLPHKTLFHEAAHILLGHTEEGSLNDSEITPRSLREVEAEAVALLCCESLSLPGAEYSRGYIQSWAAGESISERSAQRIFTTADQILKAGKESGAN